MKVLLCCGFQGLIFYLWCLSLLGFFALLGVDFCGTGSASSYDDQEPPQGPPWCAKKLGPILR